MLKVRTVKSICDNYSRWCWCISPLTSRFGAQAKMRDSVWSAFNYSDESKFYSSLGGSLECVLAEEHLVERKNRFWFLYNIFVI